MKSRSLAAISTVTLLLSSFVVSTQVAFANDTFPVAVTVENLPDGCVLDAENGSVIEFGPDQDGTSNFSGEIRATCTYSRNLSMWAFMESNEQTSLKFVLPEVPGHLVEGNINYSFPSACNGAFTYGTSWALNNIFGENTNDFLHLRGLGSFQTEQNGNFQMWVPDNLEMSIPDWTNYGGSDPQIHDKCMIEGFGKAFSPNESSLQITSDVAHVTYQLDVPESKQGACHVVDNYGATESGILTERWLKANTKTTEEQVSCNGITQSVVARAESGSSVTRGASYNLEIKISDYALIPVAGSVQTTHSECFAPNAGLTIYGTSTEGFNSEISVGADGNFSAQLPEGSWTFNTFSQNIGLCDATLTTFVNQDLVNRPISLQVKTAKVRFQLLQPEDGFYPPDVATCQLGESEFPGEGEPDHGLVAVPLGSLSTVAQIVCGEYQRSLRVSLPSELNPVEENVIQVQTPSLQMRTISGSLKVPTNMSRSMRNSVNVVINPVYREDYSSEGWNFPSNTARLTWSSSKPDTATYRAEVPAGKYNFGSSAANESGMNGSCYPRSFFRSGKTPTVSEQFSTPIAVTGGASTVTGPSLTLPLGSYVKSTFTWPSEAKSGGLGFNIFNESRQPYIFNFGDGVDSSAGAYTYFMCLTPGTYYFKAVTGSSTVGSQFFGGVTDLNKAKPVYVNKDGTSTKIHLDLKLKQSGSISGVLKDVDGDPIGAGYTIYANSDSGEFYSAPVSDNGSFKLSNLETPDTYSLVAASDAEFGGIGSGGKKFTFYSGSHNAADVLRIPLTTSKLDVSGISFEMSDSEVFTARDEVVPWSRLGKQESPAVSILEMANLINNGTVSVEPIAATSSQTSGNIAVSSNINFSSITDSYVDVYVLNPAQSTIVSRSFVTASIEGQSSYLGRLPVDEDRVKISQTMKVGPGLNEIVVVGTSTGKAKVLPLIAGKAKPSSLKAFKLAGTFKKGGSVSVSGIWTGNPNKITSTYKWSRCKKTTSQCTVIPGATKSSYKVASSDVGQYLRVSVSGANSSGKTTKAVSSTMKVAK